MTYKWNTLQSVFRLPNPPIPIKEVDGKKVVEFKDILKAWDETDNLVSDWEIKFFEELYNKSTKEQKSILKTTLELLYADRKEIKRRATHHRGQASIRPIGWGRG